MPKSRAKTTPCSPDGKVLKDIESGDVSGLEARKTNKENFNSLYPDPRNSERKLSPLHLAVELGSQPIVRLLIDGGADVNMQDSQGATPLACAMAAAEPPRDVIEVLLEHDVDVKISSPEGSPAFLAVSKGEVQLLEKFLDKGADVGSDGSILSAAISGNKEVVELFLAKNVALDVQDKDGATPLMLLLRNGHKDLANDILASHASKVSSQIGIQDNKGFTTLMVASELDAREVMLHLIELGASVDIQDNVEHDTVIMQTLKRKQWELGLGLAMHSNQIDAKNSKGETALALALASDQEDLIEGVLSKGADVGTKCGELLKKALDKKQDGIVAQLIKTCKSKVLMDLDIDFKNLVAAGFGKAPIAYNERFEEDEGPLDDTPIDDDCNTHLHNVAKQGGTYAFAVELIKKGLNPNKQNKNGDTPLHVAAKAGNVEACRALIDGGADALARNNKNRTPRAQVKIPQATKDFLLDAEEEAKERKKEKASSLWDNKMKATQTESAFGLRVV
ncbi:hypothetical protein BSKO_06737 [Bryopsis sp. KO-2023]|nr:hypothetical protein BSKO_06737 [Bryopsis sp. KO-2023]